MDFKNLTFLHSQIQDWARLHPPILLIQWQMGWQGHPLPLHLPLTSHWVHRPHQTGQQSITATQMVVNRMLEHEGEWLTNLVTADQSLQDLAVMSECQIVLSMRWIWYQNSVTYNLNVKKSNFKALSSLTLNHFFQTFVPSLSEASDQLFQIKSNQIHL